jgi:hypothetical protein
MINIKLRYNNESRNEFDKWRLLIDDNEYIVSEVIFECQTVTTCDTIIVNGLEVEKYHISAISKERIIFDFGGEPFVRVTIQ